MNILAMVVRVLKSEVKGLTVLDSLLTLFVTSFVVVCLSMSINQVFYSIQETLFFADFENMYLETQRLCVTKGESGNLRLSSRMVVNDYRELVLPETVQFDGEQTIVFDAEGGNSSLAKCYFHTRQKTVKYQLYLGSGKYQKTESQRVYTP